MEHNLADALRQHARSRPDHPALIDGDVRLTYRQLDACVDVAMAALRVHGLQSGDLVGLNLRDHAGHVVMMWACIRAGLVLLPLDCRWTDSERQAVVRHFGATCVLRERGTHVAEAPSLVWEDLLPRHWAWEAGPGAALFAERADFRADGPAVPPADATLLSGDLESPLLLSLSSGTTGRPKGPRITHRHFLRRFWTHWINLGLNASSRYVCATPLYFGGGRTFTLSVLFSGGTVIMCPPPFEPDVLAAAVRAHDANALFLVPTQLRRLLRAPPEVRSAFQGLRLLISSGAPLQPNERIAILESLCPNFHEYYASTEGGGVSLCTPQDFRHHPGSVGRAIFGVEVQVVDDDGRTLPPGVVGLLRYRGPGVAEGFFQDPEQTALHFRDGWFHPGDLAEIDADGYVHLRGRAKDMIIRGGINIYPNEVEDVLMRLPAVQECAVLGVPDLEMGESVACVWVSTQDLTPEALTAHCRTHLSPYKVPTRWMRVDALPVNSGGKVVKAALRERLAADGSAAPDLPPAPPGLSSDYDHAASR